MKKITICEVCGNSELTPVLNLGMHPMCDDLVEVGEQRQCVEYPIEILFCDRCKTAHQKYQVPKEDLFPSSYHYRSRFTQDVIDGMSALVESCEKRFGNLHGKKVLDIGCNDGSLLGFFAAKGSDCYGIEPTDAAQDAKANGLAVMQEYFDAQTAHELLENWGKPDFITFTNVFAHIENLRGLLSALSLIMDDSTVLVIENHYLGSVLRGNQFDTFYHEHPRTYSLLSFSWIAQSLKASLLSAEFPSRYGGNIRVFIGKRDLNIDSNLELNEMLAKEAAFSEDIAALGEKVELWKAAKGQLIRDVVARNGPMQGKAFPGRSAILVKLLGLTTKDIASVAEKPGSLKVGYYLPGTRIPIISDDDVNATNLGTKPILNLAWHIHGEIESYMKQKGYSGKIIPILEDADFLEIEPDNNS